MFSDKKIIIPRFFLIAIGLIFFLICASSSIADEEPGAINQEQPLSNPVPASGDPLPKESISIEAYLELLNLKMYEASVGDLTSCKDDQTCLLNAKRIKSWQCAASVCAAEDKSKEPMACFEGSDVQFSAESLKQLNTLVCPLIKSPSSETRQALSNIPNVPQDNLVEAGAAILALNGSAESCQDYIKNYVGAYGPQWNYKWYRALAGCRILARESTFKQEEQDFSTWFGAVLGLINCSGIVNSALSEACNTSGAASPIPTNEMLFEAAYKEEIKSVEQLQFKRYEAAVGDLSICENDEICLKHAKKIKAWFCMARVCEGEDKKKEPISCFDESFDLGSREVVNQVNALMCVFVKSLDAETRQALSSLIPDDPTSEDEFVESGAYLLTLKGKAKPCQDYIKNYVGAYGPQWNYTWYRALSGCRILARESTYRQEEIDFNTWFLIDQGLGQCSEIVNSELRSACSTPGATSPKPVQVK